VGSTIWYPALPVLGFGGLVVRLAQISIGRPAEQGTGGLSVDASPVWARSTIWGLAVVLERNFLARNTAYRSP